MTAQAVVTGQAGVEADSRVFVAMNIAETDEHSVDDMLVDPIRLAVHSLVMGVGFTIYGAMDNSRANGTYGINWRVA